MTNEFSATMLPVGKFQTDLTWMLFDPAKIMATRQEPHKPAQWVDVPVHTVLIEHPEGKILWDTGLPRDWETKWEPTGILDFWPVVADEHEWFDSRLNEVGVSLDEIDYMIFSHLHWDHAGNGSLFNGTNAQVVCSKAELDGVSSIKGYCEGPYIRHDWSELNFDTVEGDVEFLPGVKLLQTPGHSFGTMSLQLDLPDTGTLIFTSDAVFLGDNYGPPSITPGFNYDSEAWLSSVEKVRRVAQETDATVIFGHDAEQVRRLGDGPVRWT
ncbi:N-acyl homoserine lactonase family protein [Kineococcus rhizosphaerae]|uniref:Glyoxylase-like metal-dependent hydrolase (Beta-lactamase superfamily II) n=1 Tax=Kineococcus rhizosphaerae TaxID=559628 RepID=A0A2T0QSB4_9ACTN|nr:N-acyl homoserine lactonase family protein [Kineococcus rhizosphaerae]PRY07809.1 glyoxylase-like metal-dependent hydrolase (beta-lactamase superfamily II) [Kineococcus rhizosphaerae]